MPVRRPPPARGTPSPATTARRLYGPYFDEVADEDQVNAAIADFGGAHTAERAFTAAHLGYLQVQLLGRIADQQGRMLRLLEATVQRQDRLFEELRGIGGQLRGLQVAARRRARPSRPAPEVYEEEPAFEEGEAFDETDAPVLPDDAPADDGDGVMLVDEDGNEFTVEEA